MEETPELGSADMASQQSRSQPRKKFTPALEGRSNQVYTQASQQPSFLPTRHGIKFTMTAKYRHLNFALGSSLMSSSVYQSVGSSKIQEIVLVNPSALLHVQVLNEFKKTLRIQGVCKNNPTHRKLLNTKTRTQGKQFTSSQSRAPKRLLRFKHWSFSISNNKAQDRIPFGFFSPAVNAGRNAQGTDQISDHSTLSELNSHTSQRAQCFQ
ncbi:hypothetical protein PHYBLDRAFT_142303 [Phycomyces blakesleeanus NRRL 1555(-)]|uniref:Uncharacterized protein n=1 Tax=Phycomyces blakesleeanus (strain ATCC 8743b / DSM 1359 / FGSC 10004 / NBRC 33097 / NRRL 1555) TaxID=763407 RepID=A0A162PX25_PHYB8|nr:hypothetical protein PHYBLDRAFT_142303 [Phycomyces blakesleeanus NRRL 1555(-)]OAD76797.1 hypothetical protein PHYBLDRAFT_142303 [Phycomyces blakesleeanus NRRL 1555(-)]|eukprot:XP_018294837.1 hypothetical protein PHYBLDRAFT_142303 [Phycomyces blakesleeanus NRRL 1555(-)]